ncbi:phosphatase PAP2 family protein [Oceanomicrobium pacificus]|uniref:Phosphatase PAP2 family protein n=1 Tax=Oceanomicrobium pacificus TaxID=2692916 RepID=A0A6B0TUN1_9RHOB|nr:phosphatase PAP2 family protein [Oceanomicrobium pacificus]MXU64952.1 phosphatase PAP2 family protein [Oceanomicrobium pacificus]
MLSRLAPLSVMCLLVLTCLLAPTRASADADRMERIGDTLQIALPVTAAFCSFGKSAFKDFAGRFVLNMGLVHGSKNLLGEAQINKRPNGGDKGFPSGHTAASMQGAAYLARECVRSNPWAQATLFGAAMFVGGSRIEAGKHFLFQVIWGGLVGFMADRAFRGTFGSALGSMVRRRRRRLLALVRGRAGDEAQVDGPIQPT